MNGYEWGVRPVLFYVGKIPIESYPVFMFLAILTGVLIYIQQLKRDGIKNSNALYVAVIALTCGVIGAKLPIIIINWDAINNSHQGLAALLSGRTIVGSLVGGAIGTLLAKRLLNIKDKLGNQLAIPVAAGMAIGRIGCLLRGCCFGKATGQSWGVDFGDHILRHPTQIYEMIFDIMLLIFLVKMKKRVSKPGELFKILLNSYFVFRFFMEFIRSEKIAMLGLTDFQWLCIVGVIYINRDIFMRGKKRIEGGVENGGE